MRKNYVKAIEFKLLMINTFIYVAASTYIPFISSYYSINNIDATQIGILLTIGPLVAIFVQPLWAFLSDRSGKRKSVLALVALGSGITMLTYYLGNSFFSFLIATLLVTSFNTSLVPLSDAIIIENTKKYKLNFAFIRMGGTIGYAVAIIAVRKIIKAYPASQFIISTLGYLILLPFILQLPNQDNHKEMLNINAFKNLTRRKKLSISNIFVNNDIYFVLIFAFICQLGLSFYSGFLGVYILERGYSQSTIGVMNCISALSEVPILFLINKLIKKFGTVKIIFLSCIFMSVRVFLVTIDSIAFTVMAQLLQSVTYMTVYYSCVMFISENVKKGSQSEGQSILTITQAGFGSIFGNIIGGILIDNIGIKNSYIIISLSILIVSLFVGAVYFLKMAMVKKGKCTKDIRFFDKGL